MTDAALATTSTAGMVYVGNYRNDVDEAEQRMLARMMVSLLKEDDDIM